MATATATANNSVDRAPRGWWTRTGRAAMMRNSLIGFTRAEVAAYYTARMPNLAQRGKEWRGPCPIHNGGDDNFAVNAANGQWFCHSQCGRGEDILGLEQALTGADFKTAHAEVFRLVGRPEPNGGRSSKRATRSSGGTKRPKHGGKKLREIESYGYTDQDGDLLFEVVRCEKPNGEKTFLQRRPDGKGGRIWNLDGVLRVPYRLPKVLKAETIYLPEGEKDVHTLEAWGLTAACNPGGAGNGHLYAGSADYFRSRHVILLVDNDEPGRRHAVTVAAALLGVTASVRIVEFPDLPETGDVTDWRDAGGTREELERLTTAANPLDAATFADLQTRWGLEKQAERQGEQIPFEVNENGVFWLKPNSDGTTDPVKLSALVEVIAKTRDARGGNWGRLLRWSDDEDRRHEWAMPMEALASDPALLRARLLAGGLPFISTNPRNREKLAEYFQTAPAGRYACCVTRVGWHDEVFVLPDVVIGKQEAEAVLYQGPSDGTNNWASRGTAVEWREQVGTLCAGNSRLVLSVSCGFAGPLLSLVGEESGGIHFHGSTSTGKSTALRVGASVCGGGGNSGFVHPWRATLNGLEAIAELHNDATLFLDEFAQVDPKEAAETAYLLANGQGKTRANRNMGTRPKLTWTLLFLSAGEITLAEHAASVGRRARGGAEVRLLNVPVDAGKDLGTFENLHGHPTGDGFSRTLREATQRCYGAPFRAFLDALTQKREAAEKTVRAAREAFAVNVPAGAEGEVKRAADRFALIGAAGELATEFGLTGWPAGEASSAAAKCFQAWLKGRGTIGASDVEAAIRQIRAFLGAHGTSRFQSLRSSGNATEKAEAIRDRAGFRRYNPDSGELEYWVLPETFRRELCVGFDSLAVLRELDRRSLLRREPPDMTIKPRLPEIGSARVYCLRAAILGGDA